MQLFECKLEIYMGNLRLRFTCKIGTAYQVECGQFE